MESNRIVIDLHFSIGKESGERVAVTEREISARGDGRSYCLRNLGVDVPRAAEATLDVRVGDRRRAALDVDLGLLGRVRGGAGVAPGDAIYERDGCQRK